MTASRPIGPEAQLLSVLDRRLRDALRARRVSELDGLVFAAAGSTDVRSNALVARRARQWATHHRLPLRRRVRRRVRSEHRRGDPDAARPRDVGTSPSAAGSWPPAAVDRTRPSWPRGRRGRRVGPAGRRPEIAEVALTRYVVAAMDLVAVDEPWTSRTSSRPRCATSRWSAPDPRTRRPGPSRPRRRSRRPASSGPAPAGARPAAGPRPSCGTTSGPTG